MGLNVMQGDIMGERAISMMAEENGTEALKSSASYRFDAADVQAGAQILYQAAGDFWSKYPYEACGAQANSILKISSFGTQDTTVSCECGKDSPWRAADGNNISVHDVSAAFAAFLGTKLPGATVTVALTNSGTDKSVFDKVESVTYSYGGQTAGYTWEDALGVTAPAATEPAPETPEPTAQPTPEAQPDAMQPPTQAEDLPAPETETQVTPQPVESEMPAE